MGTIPDLAMPQISAAVKGPLPDGSEILMLVVETATTHYEFVIADQTTYRTAAATLADGITRAGATMKKKSALVEVKEIPHALRRKK